jgi:hypothetical protein
VKEAKLATINDKPWRTSVSLDHVAELWMSVLEACWRVAGDGILEEFIEVRSLKFGMASFVDIASELEDFCDVFARE